MMMTIGILVNIGIISLVNSACRNWPADIGFLVDGSGSVQENNFKLNLEMISNFVDLFDFGETAVKFSAYPFSDNVEAGFNFKCCSNEQEVKTRISNFVFSNQGTNFKAPLAFAGTDMFQSFNGARTLALKILLFFTDGRAYNFEDEARILHDQGIIVFAVGIGNDVLDGQLEAIATNKNYVFRASDYASLVGSVYNEIHNKTCHDVLVKPCSRDPMPCKNSATCIDIGNSDYRCHCVQGFTGPNCEKAIDHCENVTCNNGGTCINSRAGFTCSCANYFTSRYCDIDLCQPFPTDVVFILDSSYSQGEKFHNISKDFIINVTRNWIISEKRFQVAVVTFTNDAKVSISFDTASSFSKFASQVNDLRLLSGTSEVYRGVSLANSILQSRHRIVHGEPVHKLVIVISDGLWSTPSQIYNCNGHGIECLAVAVGEDVSHYWLQRLVGSSERVFPYTDKSLSNFITNSLVDPVCRVCTRVDKADVVFAVDQSHGFSNEEMAITVPSILNKIISEVQIGPLNTQVMLVTFSNTSKIQFGLTDYDESRRQDLQRRLSYYSQDEVSEPNITELLNQLQSMILNTSLGFRSIAKKAVIILSPFNFTASSHDKLILRDNVNVFTIGLHNNEAEFRTMSDTASSSFHIGIYGMLPFNMIETFISCLVEQLHYYDCTI